MKIELNYIYIYIYILNKETTTFSLQDMFRQTKLKVVVSLLRIIATLLSLRPFGNIIYDIYIYIYICEEERDPGGRSNIKPGIVTTLGDNSA